MCEIHDLFDLYPISVAEDPRSCGDLTCDPNAECFSSSGLSHCICRTGYIGKGEIGPNGEPGCEGTHVDTFLHIFKKFLSFQSISTIRVLINLFFYRTT